MDNVFGCVRLTQIQKDLKELKKKFKSIDDDLVYAERLLECGQKLPQTDPYPGFEKHKVYKTRVINVSSGKGKSSGYRLIYEDISTDDKKKLLLIYLYDKPANNNESSVRIEIRTRFHSPEYKKITQ
jgi:mRNA-degrading endonuclease RelE of RelBE toxin-antitoxin system